MKSTEMQRDVTLGAQESSLIIAKSGLEVNINNREWVLLPNFGKGRLMHVGWVHSIEMAKHDREFILEVLVYYARNKAASTASGIAVNIKTALISGIPTLGALRSMWSGLKTNNKKGLNQFFCTLFRLGHILFKEYHEFTTANLDKSRINSLDTSRGALSNIEFDSLAKLINGKLQEIDWGANRTLSFYQTPSSFGSFRNRITNKLMLSIVRRPIQIALLKWSDLIPSGSSYNDPNILATDEIGTMGAQTLQIRVFVVKSKGVLFSRGFPERYPIHLSESISQILIEYKKLVCRGLELLMSSSGFKVGKSQLLALMCNMPIFPDHNLFNSKLDSFEVFARLFTPISTAYHTSETTVAGAIMGVQIASDRLADCNASSNRIRHTVLTRGAQNGLSAMHLAKITGVTVPAARHYIDLDYKSRLQIDLKYVGNDFLKKAFSETITEVLKGDESILDDKFNPVGASRNQTSCISCSTKLGRPLGCYGCPNFRPIVEADHRSVLQRAEDKLLANRSSLIGLLNTRSTEKLEKQIEWLKLTVAICDEIRLRRQSINAK